MMSSKNRDDHETGHDEKKQERRRYRHSWRDPNTWMEVQLMRGAGLGALWLTSGLLSLAARRTRQGLIKKRARRLGKNR